MSSRARPALLALLTISAVLAGCSAPAPSPGPGTPDNAAVLPALPNFKPLPLVDRPVFAAPLLVDAVRAGGEPVIAVSHAGTILVSSHPGFTHYHPSADPAHAPTEIATPVNGESYLWRSTDKGTSFVQVGVAGTTQGPRGTGPGVSDPEFTVMPDGAICYTDLEALASASVQCSTDDGVTWLGNPLASGGPVDRQWLASYGNELYFTSAYLAAGDHHIRASTDKGLTWEDRGNVPCSGDIIANPANGHLYTGCGNGLAVSADAGRTWSERRTVPSTEKGAAAGGGIIEPAIDSAGNIWTAWQVDEHRLFAAGTPDEGKTWPWVIDLTPHVRLAADAPVTLDYTVPGDTQAKHDTIATANGTFVWPWISAGSDGRFAVTWIGAYPAAASSSYQGPWYMFTAFVVGATTTAPTVVVERLTPQPMHVGPICQQGTFCQVGSVQGEPASDRRLGDFFETTIEPGTGMLLGAWANTYDQPNDVISHVQFVRQTGGLPLIAPQELASFRPTQG